MANRHLQVEGDDRSTLATVLAADTVREKLLSEEKEILSGESTTGKNHLSLQLLKKGKWSSNSSAANQGHAYFSSEKNM